MKKVLMIVILFLFFCSYALAVPPEYVDLGLPSGTLWKNSNETGYYDYQTAMETYGLSLPSSAQFKELFDNCTWTWVGKGYKIEGPNGNYIFLPALGYKKCSSTGYQSIGDYGHYWSTSQNELYFTTVERGVSYTSSSCFGYSVRLVKEAYK